MAEMLQGRIAFVTGAAQGIGEAVTSEFCKEGASVFMGDRDGPRLEATAQAFREQGYPVVPCTFDTTLRDQVRAAVGLALERFGTIDVLVNNAGFYPRRHFLEMTEVEWDEMLAGNLTGTFNCTRAVAPLMVERKRG